MSTAVSIIELVSALVGILLIAAMVLALCVLVWV